jgi:hypothetical protein
LGKTVSGFTKTDSALGKTGRHLRKTDRAVRKTVFGFTQTDLDIAKSLLEFSFAVGAWGNYRPNSGKTVPAIAPTPKKRPQPPKDTPALHDNFIDRLLRITPDRLGARFLS